MKTKTLSLVALVVVLIGGICLDGYARRYQPTWKEEDARQRQLFEQEQLLKQQRHDRFAEKQQQKLDKGAEKKSRKKENYLLRKLQLLEERVTRLEHALTTELSHAGVLPDMQGAFDAETIRRSNESKAEIQRAVHNRVLKAVVPLEDASTFAPE